MKFEKQQNPILQKAPSPVRSALVLICEKCGRKICGSDDPDKNPSRLIQKEMKQIIAETVGKKEMRALVTTCMNLCPKDKIATCLVRIGETTTPPTFYEATISDLDPSTAAHEILDELKRELF